MAAHYGFTPKACRPYRARTKGKTERMVHYVKHHFFVRYRAFESVAHLNQQLEQWLVEEADRRVHGTHGEVVVERFDQERDTLGPLPAQPYDTSYREYRHVSMDGYIDVRGNRYSVPASLCGHTVAVRIGLDETVRVIDANDTVVAFHALRPVHAGWQTDSAHHLPLWNSAGGVDTVERRALSVYEEVSTWS